MEEVVYEADQRFSLFGEQRMHRLKAVAEAAPSHLRHVHRHVLAGLILLPKRLPARAVLRFGVSDDERGRQFVAPLGQLGTPNGRLGVVLDRR